LVMMRQGSSSCRVSRGWVHVGAFLVSPRLCFFSRRHLFVFNRGRRVGGRRKRATNRGQAACTHRPRPRPRPRGCGASRPRRPRRHSCTHHHKPIPPPPHTHTQAQAECELNDRERLERGEEGGGGRCERRGRTRRQGIGLVSRGRHRSSV
jgi:hypothetical protein